MTSRVIRLRSTGSRPLGATWYSNDSYRATHGVTCRAAAGQGTTGSGWRLSAKRASIPQLKPDLQFGVRIQGNVTDRIRLDVDFDQAREFSAANNINIFYEGKEDEVLQRLELGDVTFELPTSRFLTRGIPAGNFGFQAQGQAGPLEFRGVWAQQRGDLSTR